MLKKLLKYDLEYNYKILVIFYLLAIFFAVFTRICFSIENSFIMNIIGQISSGVTISMIFNIIINNLIRLWVRFKNNFYNDEAYLTHTLPINKKTLYLSKILSSIISLFGSITVIGLTLFIAYYSKENIELIKNILMPLADLYNSTIINILLSFLFIFFLEFLNILQAGYTGLILGHMMNNYKLGFSVLYGFIFYGITQISVLLMLLVVGLFNKDIMNLFYTTTIIDIDLIKFIIYLAIIIYSFIIVINYFINIKLINKGVNVD